MEVLIFCTNCGNKCDSSFKFCNSCGTKLINEDDNIEEVAIIESDTTGVKCNKKPLLKSNLSYLGSHPYYPKECKLDIKIYSDSIELSKLFGRQVIIPMKDIRFVKIETEEEVVRRFTATRIALFGPFALAMKKKKVNKNKYLIIECNDFTLTFEEGFLARIVCTTLYDALVNYGK